MKISSCKGILNKKVGGDYIVYSPLSGETAVINQLASFILDKTLVQDISYQELVEQIESEFFGISDTESILQKTLTGLSKKGFIYY